MAYMRKGYILIRAGGRELIIDEFDEDSIEIETMGDKTSTRTSSRGKPIYSITDKVAYELTISIKPDTSMMNRILDFLRYLKNKDYPDFEFETHEKIDTRIVTTYYTDGNVLSELDSESAFSSDAPTNTFKIAGLRDDKKIA